MGLGYYYRGFVAITLVQQIGILVQIFIDSDSLQKAFLQPTDITKRAIRPYVALFFVNAVHQLILKAVLQCSFNNAALHVVHALGSLAQFTFIVLEVFVYEYLQKSTATYIQIIFSALIFIMTVIFWSSIISDEPLEEKEREPRPRRLIARHYMESSIKDLETDPKKLK